MYIYHAGREVTHGEPSKHTEIVQRVEMEQTAMRERQILRTIFCLMIVDSKRVKSNGSVVRSLSPGRARLARVLPAAVMSGFPLLGAVATTGTATSMLFPLQACAFWSPHHPCSYSLWP